MCHLISTNEGTKKKTKKKEKESIKDSIDTLLEGFVPPNLDDISDTVEVDKPESRVQDPPRPVFETKKTSSVRPPRPLHFGKPLSERPPAPRPLPLKKKTKSSQKNRTVERTQVTPPSPKPEKSETKKPEIQKPQSIAKPSPIRITQVLEDPVSVLSFFQDVEKEIRERPLEESWPWVKSPKVEFPRELLSLWRKEGSLFATLHTLELYHNLNEQGELPPGVYHRQLKKLLSEALQLRFRLEKDKNFDFETFIEQEQLSQYCKFALEKLKLAEGISDLDSLLDDGQKLDYQTMTKLPTRAADYVSNAIELMDLIRLQAIATTDRILPLLDEMRGILLQTLDIFGEDYWVITEIEAWRRKLELEAPGTILPEDELERLEMQAVRWMNDFRRELKNL